MSSGETWDGWISRTEQSQCYGLSCWQTGMDPLSYSPLCGQSDGLQPPFHLGDE